MAAENVTLGGLATKAGKGAFGALKGVAGPAIGGLSLLFLLSQVKDLIGELTNEDLSLKNLFTGVGKKEEARLTKKVQEITKQRKKSKVTRELLNEQFGKPQTAFDKARPKLTDLVDIETLRKIIPLAAANDVGFGDILGQDNVNSPIFQALNPKEQKSIKLAISQPVQNPAQLVRQAMNRGG